MFEHWPLPIEFKPRSNLVSLTNLEPITKRKAWAFIKNNRPALSELITEISENEELQALIKLTGAQLCVERNVFLNKSGDDYEPECNFLDNT